MTYKPTKMPPTEIECVPDGFVVRGDKWFVLTINKLNRLFVRLGDKRLAYLGLSVQQFFMLHTIENGSYKNVTSLANVLEVERSTAIRGVSILRDNGWVSSGRLALTPGGRFVLHTAMPIMEQFDKEMLSEEFDKRIPSGWLSEE